MIRRPITSTSSSRTGAGASSSPTRGGAWSWPSPPGRSRTRGACGSRPTRSSTGSSTSGSPPARHRPSDGDPRVERLEILPARSFQRVGAGQQILVRARYSDGRSEDVTRWVKWSSADESVCRVDEQRQGAGRSGPARGRSWPGTPASWRSPGSPFRTDRAAGQPGELVDRRKPRNFIDEQIDKQLARLNLPASPACSDAEFVRRAYVDTIGRLPDDRRGPGLPRRRRRRSRRDALIDSLLARPEFADYWTYKWSDLLMLNGTRLRPAGAQDLLPVDPQASGRRRAVGPVRPRDRHRRPARASRTAPPTSTR